jgi:hypothetical protein
MSEEKLVTTEAKCNYIFTEYGKQICLHANGTNINFESNKLVEFDKFNKMIFNNSIDNLESECVVLSMIGCARVGKSTFINAFLSYLFGANVYCVKTANGGDHCTLGIDYISFPYKLKNSDETIQIIILDCQGLLYEDSKNDDKLLSVIYSLSDIIVYHDTGIVNNQTLNALTPLCLVADQIKDSSDAKEIKPTLFFRMRDFDLECNPQEIVQKTFTKRDDQYDRVRGAINKLFPKINTIVTDPLGKHEKIKLKNMDYTEIVYDDKYGFVSAYEEILQCMQSVDMKKIDLLCKHANKLVTQINHNEKISFNDYDYYTLLIEKRFRSYWDDINHDIYLPINPGCEEIVYKSCVDRLDDMNIEIAKFKDFFSEVAQTMIDEEINKFKEKIEPHILATMDKCCEMAENVINAKLQKLINEYIVPVYKNVKIFGNRRTSCLKKMDDIINKICDNFSKLCVVTVNKLKSLLIDQIVQINSELIKKIDRENSLFDNVNKNCFKILDKVTDITYLEQKIEEISVFTMNCDEHFADIQRSIKNEIAKEFRHKFFVYSISGIVYQSSDNGLRIEWIRRNSTNSFGKNCADDKDKSDDNNKDEPDDDNETYDKKMYDQLFCRLFKQITERIDDNIFKKKREQLTTFYVCHVKRQLNQISIESNIMTSQSLISFTKLHFLIDNEKMKIVQSILGNSFNRKFKKTNGIYVCCHLKENIDDMIKTLCDYVDFKYDYAVDNLLVITTPKNYTNNISKYTIDFSKLYGKIFITRIIDKYIDMTYLK